MSRSPNAQAAKQQLKPNAKKPWFFSAGLWFVGLAGAVFFYCVYALTKPMHFKESVFEVKSSQTFNTVINQLVSEGKMTNATLIKVYRKLFIHEQLKAGLYEIPHNVRVYEFLNILNKDPKYATKALRIVEGKRFSHLRALIQDNPSIVQTVSHLTNEQLVRLIDANAPFWEGMFAPNTYDYMIGEKDFNIYKRLYDQQQSLLENAWQARDANLPYKNKYDALIMASIIEKETSLASERRRVAGVFVERLKIGMRLQTDPTVIYGMGDRYNGNITRADLRKPTPFNTYTIYGLPPTPIALPSQAAIEAAMHPELRGELYFVASGEGGHVFSKTLDAHNAAVKAYVEKLKAKREAAQAQNENAEVSTSPTEEGSDRKLTTTAQTQLTDKQNESTPPATLKVPKKTETIMPQTFTQEELEQEVSAKESAPATTEAFKKMTQQQDVATP